MSLTRQKTGLENIAAKTVTHANFAAMTAAEYASAKNPVTVKNQKNINLDKIERLPSSQIACNKEYSHESHKLLF